MGRALSLAWKLVSWTMLVVGLFWTNKVEVPEIGERPPPLPQVTLRLAAEPTQADLPATETDLPLRLGLRVYRDDDPIAIDDWIKTSPDVRVVVRRENEPPVELSGREFAALDSMLGEKAQYLIVAQSRITGGAANTVEARIEGAARKLLAWEPALFFGRLPNEKAIEIRRLRPTLSQSMPGLTLLLGALGVFVHVFMTWARLMVPLRPELPPEEL